MRSRLAAASIFGGRELKRVCSFPTTTTSQFLETTMSASARAEARRKAILSRGSDRLAKLTTSARGEDAPAYMKDGMS